MWLKYSLMIVFFTFLFLFAQKPVTPTRTYCGEYVHVSKMGFVLFCDSYQYIFLTNNPSLLLDRDFLTYRQSRPLYIYAAHLVGLPIRFIMDEFVTSSFFKEMGGEKYLYQKSINEKLASSPFLKIYHIEDHKNLVLELLPFYIAFLLLNFIILLLSLCLFERLLKRLEIESFIIHFLSLFMVCSGIVKAFFFSAHEQMFAFFTPIAIAYIVYLFLNNEIQQKRLWLISFLMGILCLAYGSFILYLPCLLIANLIKQHSFRISFSLVRTLFINGILFIIPTIIWVNVCLHYTGRYFSGEVAVFREFVWIIDALSVGCFHFLHVSFDFLFKYLNTVLITLTPFFIGIYFLNKEKRKLKDDSPPTAFYIFLKWMFLLYFTFFLLLGYYNFRLTYTCVPVLLILISVMIQQLLNNNSIERNKLVKRLRLLSIVWIIWSIVKYGPFPFQ